MSLKICDACTRIVLIDAIPTNTQSESVGFNLYDLAIAKTVALCIMFNFLIPWQSYHV